MGMDLRLLPFDADSFSHTILDCERRRELWDPIFEIEKRVGRDVPEEFTSFSSRETAWEDNAYGKTTLTARQRERPTARNLNTSWFQISCRWPRTVRLLITKRTGRYGRISRVSDLTRRLRCIGIEGRRMGREIRRVVPNWEHPRRQCEHSPWQGGCDEAKAHGGQCFQPLIDEDFESAAKEWRDNLAAWEGGERQAYLAERGSDLEYWEYAGDPPDRKYHRPKWREEDRIWLQIYETVSEGTPVTPAFATKAELVDYLVANGDRWDQHRGDGPWKRENAESFVESEWAPSGMAIIRRDGSGEFKAPRDGVFAEGFSEERIAP